MKRGALILSGILLAGLLIYSAVFHAGTTHARLASQDQGELQWLKLEFQMSDAQFAQVLELHTSHDEACLAHCRDLEAINATLQQRMVSNSEITPEVEELLNQAAVIRERCRKTTLEHVYAVSEAMSPEAGARYREMMVSRLIDRPAHLHMHQEVGHDGHAP